MCTYCLLCMHVHVYVVCILIVTYILTSHCSMYVLCIYASLSSFKCFLYLQHCVLLAVATTIFGFRKTINFHC